MCHRIIYYLLLFCYIASIVIVRFATCRLAGLPLCERVQSQPGSYVPTHTVLPRTLTELETFLIVLRILNMDTFS